MRGKKYALAEELQSTDIKTIRKKLKLTQREIISCQLRKQKNTA